MNFGYLVALVAGMVMALSVKFLLITSDSARLRLRAFEKQREAEALQPQIVAAKDQLQRQQEQLNRGFIVGEKVGPAVLEDLQTLAHQPDGERIRELLIKHRFPVSPTPQPGK